MKRWMLCTMMFLLGWGLAASPLTAADEDKKDMKKEKTAPTVEAKAPDGSKWAKAAEQPAIGEFAKGDESTLTLRYPPAKKGAKPTEVMFTWNEQGLARRKDPPKFFDDKGLPRKGSSEEVAKLKKPAGVPGYMMERSELKPGDIVQLELVRPSTVSAAKAKPEDLTIKYATVIGEKAMPSKK